MATAMPFNNVNMNSNLFLLVFFSIICFENAAYIILKIKIHLHQDHYIQGPKSASISALFPT